MTSGTLPGQQDRPDLTAQACVRDAEESPADRGQLRTYLGIAPGVGKTYAMLRDGRAGRRAGVDAVVAYRERHGRAATAAQLADLEVLPTRTVTYRGASFAELDVAAVLDRRGPGCSPRAGGCGVVELFPLRKSRGLAGARAAVAG
jgi:K+-sensing histidine kinase KdpD